MKILKVAGQVILKNLKYITLVLVVILVSFSFYSKYKSAQAGISDDGNHNVTIGGDTYVIDTGGNIYNKPDKTFTLNNGSADAGTIDYRYYAYTGSSTGKKVDSTTNLTIEKDATVIMEGALSLNNLTIKGRVEQPLADRSGMINKPLYSNRNWSARFVGFVAIPASSRLRLYTADKGTYDAYSIDIGSSDTISSSSWNQVYAEKGGSYASWTEKNTTEAAYQSDATSYNLLTNSTAATRYVPIRISFSHSSALNGNSATPKLDVTYTKYGTADWVPTGSGTLPKNWLYGQGTDGKMRADVTHSDGSVTNPGNRLIDFSYYLNDPFNPMVDPVQDYLGGPATASKRNLNLATDLVGYGDTSSSSNLDFEWSTTLTPLGELHAEVYNEIASRYTSFPVNTKAYESSRQIRAGLDLNVADTFKVESEGEINLTGSGYPGADGELNGNSSHARGGSLDASGSPGGGYTNTNGCNGAAGSGGSNAGRGGYLKTDNNCGEPYARADSYGSVIDPFTLGSGGGTANDDADPNIAGSGGGAIKITANKIELNKKNAIIADGDGGRRYGWHTQTGGAGGSVFLKANNTFAVNPSGNGNKVISANGSNGDPVNRNGDVDWHIGGGGGYVTLQYPKSKANKSEADVIALVGVEGGNGGKFGDSDPYSNNGGDTDTDLNNHTTIGIIDGESGKITIQDNLICTGAENLVVKKETLKGLLPMATFEAGDTVDVRLTISEPGDPREDFVIEDSLPPSQAGKKITVKLRGESQTVTADKDGKIKIEGSSKFYLEEGENTLTYSYSL